MQIMERRSMSFTKIHLRMLYIYILFGLFTCNSMHFTAKSISLGMSKDKEALLSIKSHLTFQSPNPLSTWDANASPCNWTGVSCNEYSRRVIGLDLSRLRLTGSISPHIGNLSFLTSLHLQNNQLSGMLPDEIGNLLHLRVLNMSKNIIEGAMPPNISQCNELGILDLAQNQISGEIPDEISSLRQLQVLNLGGNRLSGRIPDRLANISSLQILTLSSNMLAGTIPSVLGHLQLRHLDLENNNLTGSVPPSIYNMSSLEFLGLALNDMWGNIPYDIGVTLPNLLAVELCGNRFTGTIPGSLHNLTKMQIITMQQNFLHGALPPGLGNLPDLLRYDIAQNSIVSSGKDGLSFLESLTNSTRLRILMLDGNLLEGEIPDSIGHLSSELSYLSIGRNHIFGSIPSSVGNLSSLGTLDLSHNSIVGEIPEEIGQLENIQMLGLAGNYLSGKIPSSLGNLYKLNMIDLSENELDGNIPRILGNLQNLLSMDLSGNKFNGSIPTEVLNLPSLSMFLNLSRNDLSGPLPVEVGKLQVVGTINISHNRLSGEIPKTIENCKSLEHLLFANNMFSSQIPDTLGAIQGLETLDLSSNQLSGEIPTSLQKLKGLQLLNLSFNNLEGEVPVTGVFGVPSKVHLEGNPNLCFHWPCIKNHSHTKRMLLVGVILAIAIVFSIILGVGLLFHSRNNKERIDDKVKSFRREHQMVTYDQLRLATDGFNKQNLIGKGSFGSVYRVILDGIVVAVKVLDAEISRSWKSFSAECAALRNARHRNLVKLNTICSSIDFRNTEFLALVYEFMSNGNLEEWLTGNGSANGKVLNVLERLNVAIDVTSALEYLHHQCETPVIHCDLKPENVLLNSDMTAKVGDFGLARLLFASQVDETSISSTHALKGSIGYIPPEYGLRDQPSTAGDVYSFGIMLLQIFTGKSPIHEDFEGKLSLKNWVQMAFPKNIDQVLDCKLFLDENSNIHDEKFNINTEMLHECLLNVISIGLSCVADSPDVRISMTSALSMLKSVKSTLVKLEH